MLAILNRIPARTPKLAVIGMFLWCFGVAASAVAGLFLLAGWSSAYFVVFGILGLLIFGFMGCIVCLFVQSILGRVTPWRQQR